MSNNCKYYAEEEQVCCNSDCPLRADFVSNERECLICRHFITKDVEKKLEELGVINCQSSDESLLEEVYKAIKETPIDKGQ